MDKQRFSHVLRVPDRSLARVRYVFLILAVLAVAMAEIRLFLGPDQVDPSQRALAAAAVLSLVFWWGRLYRDETFRISHILVAAAGLFSYGLVMAPPNALNLTYVFLYVACLYGTRGDTVKALAVVLATFWLGMALYYEAGPGIVFSEFVAFQSVSLAIMAGIIQLLQETLTEHENLTDQLIERSKMEAVGRLAGGVAHDFNNLLTAIVGPLELALAEVAEEDEIHQDLSLAAHSARQAATLTQKLLTFGRQRPVEPVPLDVNRHVRNLHRLLDRIVGPSLVVRMDLADEVLAVEMDPIQLEQIVLNLAVNAAEAMDKKGQLVIRTDRVSSSKMPAEWRSEAQMDEYVLIQVRDSGEGMDEETRRQAMEPFYTTKEEGTGLGLSIIYGAVKEADGFVEIESAPSQGTTVTVGLPRSRKEVVREPGDPVDEAAVDRAVPDTHQILVVDDTPAVRSICRKILSREGYSVVTAKDGAAAREVAAAHPDEIVLVICDLVLPDTRGVELCGELDRILDDAAFILTSGYSDVDVKSELEKHGDLPFLEKPFGVTELRTLVEQHLRPVGSQPESDPAV